MATIHDVARLAKVSAGTVSNVLNRPSYVSAETRQRVLDVIEELNFAPRRSTRQRTIGLSVAGVETPFFVDIALAADAEAKSLGMGVVTVVADEDVRREEQNLELLLQQRVHGIVIAPVNEVNPRLEQLVERGIPIVYVDRIHGDRACCWVTTDDRMGGRLAAEHLLALGHRRLAFAGGSPVSKQGERRLEGFTTESLARGATVERISPSSWSVDEGRRAGAQIAQRDPRDRPTAVMCCNDLVALGMLQELWAHRLRVPEDVSIVGFDDLEWAAAAMVPLTTVDQKRQELGRRAVHLLLDEVAHPETHRHEHVVLEPRLVVRASTAPI